MTQDQIQTEAEKTEMKKLEAKKFEAKKPEQKKRDWPMKLLALVCAVMLWFYAEAEKNPLMDMQFDVPVQYINQGEDYVVEPSAQSVRVTVKGSEVELSGLRGDDFTATIDLQNAEIGTDIYKIELESSAAIDRITYQPMKATLQVDRKETKEVPVRVRTTGNAEDVQLASTEVMPNTVIIAGLSSQLENISDIETEAIDISALSGDTTVEAALHLPEGITLEGTEKKVQVHFMVQAEERHVNVAIAPRHVPEDMTVELSRSSADVTVGGDVEVLNSQQALNGIELYVDCAGLEAGQHTVTVQSNYSGPLEILSIRPEAVTVTLSVNDSSNGSNQEDVPNDDDSQEEESIVEKLSKKLK